MNQPLHFTTPVARACNLAFWALVLALAASASPALAQKHSHGAHVHGLVKANVAVQGGKLSVQMEMPLDSLLGFEHRPRTDAQRKAATTALQQLKAPGSWLKPTAAALCTLGGSDINAQALEPAPPGSAEQTHADLDASWDFNCAAPDKLTGVDIHLMEVFKRIQRIEVQVAGAKGQSQQTLRRPATRVVLQK